MDLTALSSLSGAVAVAAPVCMVGLFVWAIFRTESRHTLRFRLWQLIQGNREISDPVIRSYIDEQNSLMSFRFIAGVGASNLEKAHQLIRWTQLRKVEMHALRMAGDYFDSELRVVHIKKLPGKIIQGIKLALVALAIPVVLACFALIYVDSAVMKIKATDRWTLITENEAKAIWPLMQGPVTRANCATDANTAGRGTRFSDQEVKVLCSLVSEEGAASYIKETARTQWKPALILLIEMLVVVYLLCASFMSGFVARRLAKRNIDPSLDNEQLDLPLQVADQGVKSEAIASELPGPQ